MTIKNLFKIKTLIWAGFFFLSGPLWSYAESPKLVSKQAPSRPCEANVRFAIWYNGANLTWGHHYQAEIFTNGRFKIRQNYAFTYKPEAPETKAIVSGELEKKEIADYISTHKPEIPETEVVVSGKLDEEEIAPLIEKLEKAKFFSLNNVYGEVEYAEDRPAEWHISYCKEGKTKTIMSEVHEGKIPNPPELLAKEAREFFRKQLEARKIKIDID